MFSFISTYKSRKFYAQFIKKNDMCFDIGANLGTKSKLFLSLGAKVIAFEPQTSCCSALLKIKESNKQFEFYQVAIGDENKEVELNLANHIEIATLSDEFIAFYSNEEIYWNNTEIVTVKTLNSVIEKFGTPDFCKIDTEGYELNILSSLSYSIPIIEFEFTEGFFGNTLKIIDLLHSETTTFNFILNENLRFKLDYWVSAEELKSVLSALPKKRLHGNIFVKNGN